MDSLVYETLDDALENFAALLHAAGDSVGARELELERQALRVNRASKTPQ